MGNQINSLHCPTKYSLIKLYMDLFGFTKSDDELNAENIKGIDGLKLIPGFISIEEEQDLIKAIDSEYWLDDLQRKVQHYGYKYDYRARRIDASFHIGDLPSWSIPVARRIEAEGTIDYGLDQLIINNYEPGQGIAMHIDCEPCFEDTIFSLSLNSDIVMILQSVNSNKKHEVLLKRRSLLIISGESRYKFLHGIANRNSDVFNEQKRQRKRRISMTYRKVVL
jgi:alkylated DNA repair dioxygenase AlkB